MTSETVLNKGITLKEISKSFGRTRALEAVSLQLQPGKIYGLLGNNGAGKTTLLNVICNRLYADQGSVHVDGISAPDHDQVLSRMFMTGEQDLYPEGTRVSAAFRITSHFYPEFDKERALALADEFALNPRKKITSLSTGYRSIVRLILALCVNTPYLLLDEPVLGLDARHRDLFYRRLIEQCERRSSTVIISTHLIQEVAAIIEHVLMIHQGRVIVNQDAESLLASVSAVSGPAEQIDAYSASRTIISSRRLGGLKTVILNEPSRSRQLPPGLEASSVSLQDYFIHLMNGMEDEK